MNCESDNVTPDEEVGSLISHCKIVPSGYVKIAIENGPFIGDLPTIDGDFP